MNMVGNWNGKEFPWIITFLSRIIIACHFGVRNWKTQEEQEEVEQGRGNSIYPTKFI